MPAVDRGVRRQAGAPSPLVGSAGAGVASSVVTGCPTGATSATGCSRCAVRPAFPAARLRCRSRIASTFGGVSRTTTRPGRTSSDRSPRRRECIAARASALNNAGSDRSGRSWSTISMIARDSTTDRPRDQTTEPSTPAGPPPPSGMISTAATRKQASQVPQAT